MAGIWASRTVALALALASMGAGLAGCGGNSSDARELTVVLTPGSIAVRQGESVQLEVDLQGLAAGDSLAGYQIDLPESVADISITTAPCPAGSGTPGCQVWTVQPGAAAMPGEYKVSIGAAFPGTLVTPNTLTLSVAPPLGTMTPAAATLVADWPGRLMYVADDGGLWGAGFNTSGQVRSAYQTDAFSHQPSTATTPVQPWPSLALKAPLLKSFGSAALNADGTVREWGGLGTVPSITGLADIRSLRADGLRLAARDGAGRLWAPQAGGHHEVVDTSGLPITDWHVVRASSASNGLFVLGLEGDRVAWLQPAATPGGTPTTTVLPALAGARQLALANCSDDIPDLLVAGRSDCAHLLALMADGRVLAVGANHDAQIGTGDATHRPCRADLCTPFVVPLPGPALAVAAGTGRSFALLADGTLWAWGGWQGMPHPAPVQVDRSALPAGTALRTLAAGAVIDDCRGAAGGRVWVVEGAATAPRLRWLEPTGCALQSAELRVDATVGGRVDIQPLNVPCRGLCVQDVEVGTLVTLSAVPDPGYRVDTVTGSAGCSALSFTLTGYHFCEVRFVEDTPPPPPPPTQATLTLDVTGSGRVILLPAEVECLVSCSLSGAIGSTVTLQALPVAGWVLLDFSGDADCLDGQVTLSADRHCTARFIEADGTPGGAATLTVARGGSGAAAGLVRYEGSSVTCPQDCSFTVTPGEPFRLLAESTDAGVRFVRWDGCDTVEDATPGAADRCLITLNSSRTASAVFEPL